MLPVYTYVAFRSQHPDKTAIEEALKALQQNNINVRQLALWKTDNCQ
jgi:hypothetical protein